MTTLYKWRIRCVTDDKFEYVWNETEPTVCPTNESHTIDPDVTCVMDIVEPNLIKIKEETTPTGGNFRCETKVLTIAANTADTIDFVYKYPVCVYAIYFVTTSGHEGDIINGTISPNTLIGTITQNVDQNDTVLTVSDSVINNVMIGYDITITDGTNTDSLGKILSIDKTNKQITMENAAIHNFLTSTPTTVLLTVKIIENYEIGPPNQYIIGDSKIGGMYIPANIVMQLVYQNKSTDTTKKIIFKVEYTY
jgi:hypothetical protein